MLSKMSIPAIIRRIKFMRKYFDPKYDQTWNSWVDYKNRDWLDLQCIIEDDSIQDQYRKRALFLMLIPRIDMCPFYWKEDHCLSGEENGLVTSSGKINYASLPNHLIGFAGEILAESYALSMSIDIDRNSKNILYAYNQLVLRLLEILPAQDPLAAKLFDLFELNYPGGDVRIGYYPFSNILSSKEVPLRWKTEADRKMREIIIEELKGGIEDKSKKFSLIRYSEIIVYDENLVTYGGLGFFIDQITFVISVTPFNWADFQSDEVFQFKIGKILTILMQNDANDLAREFSRFYVNVICKNGLNIYGEGDKATAETLLILLEGDNETSSKVQDAISLAKERIDERIKKQREEEKEEEAIMSLMRKPID